MTDIHTHILPGVDDGSKNLDISKALLKLEIENGIKDVVLTPHQNEKNINPDKLKEKFNELKDETKDLNINLYLGSEIYYYENMMDDLKAGKLLTLNNTKYFLVEFSTRMATPVAEKMYDFIVSGYIPVIAHIERFPYLTAEEILEIHKMGCKIQVNTKAFGQKPFKRVIKFLLKNNLIDYIGTDCHDLNERSVEYDKCLKVLKKYPETLNKVMAKPEFLN